MYFQIKEDKELFKLHGRGLGFIYNDYSGKTRSKINDNVLHAAHCDDVERSKTDIRKYYFYRKSDALNWLVKERGEDRGGYTSAEMNFMKGIGQIISRMTSKNAKYVLAFPLTDDFKKILIKYKNSHGFIRLGLNFYAVSENETVSSFNPEEFFKFIEEL